MELKVLFYGGFDLEYARNQAIIHGLQKNNVKVELLNIRKGNFFVRQLKLFLSALKKKFDVLFVAYPGHVDVFLAKIICLIKRKPLIFDEFISVWDANLEYGNISGRSSLTARYLRFLDKYSALIANKVLFDTEQQIDFFVKEYSLKREKFEQVFIGANEDLFYPRQEKQQAGFTVLYYGRAAPLHGLRSIVEAASILQGKGVNFRFIGENKFFRDIRNEFRGKLKNCVFGDAVPPKNVPRLIAEADIVLGILGKTDKANRVIPNKVFEPLAAAKPIITRGSDAVREIIVNGKHALLVPPENPKALADAILKLKDDKMLREKLAKNGRKLFEEKFSEKVIGEKVKKVLLSLIR